MVWPCNEIRYKCCDGNEKPKCKTIGSDCKKYGWSLLTDVTVGIIQVDVKYRHYSISKVLFNLLAMAMANTWNKLYVEIKNILSSSKLFDVFCDENGPLTLISLLLSAHSILLLGIWTNWPKIPRDTINGRWNGVKVEKMYTNILIIRYQTTVNQILGCEWIPIQWMRERKKIREEKHFRLRAKHKHTHTKGERKE